MKNFRPSNSVVRELDIRLLDIYNARKPIHFPKYLLLAWGGSDTGRGGEH